MQEDCETAGGRAESGVTLTPQMGAILKSDTLSSTGSIFPARPEFAFYEIALAAAQYRDRHIQSLGGGWYCYTALPWIFTYRVREWTERDIEAHRSRVRKLLW